MTLFEIKECIEEMLYALGRGENYKQKGSYKTLIAYMFSKEFGEWPNMDYAFEIVRILNDDRTIRKYNRRSQDPDCSIDDSYGCIGKEQFCMLEDLFDNIIEDLISRGICPNCGSEDLRDVKRYYADSGYEVVGTICDSCSMNMDDIDNVYPNITYQPKDTLRQPV